MITLRPGFIIEYFRDIRLRAGIRAYSQEGEDLLLDRYFGPKRDGFFIDVGALDPFRFSNTYFFYRRGWRGINIDAMPGSMRRFKRYRPRDINIEVAIGLYAESATYYVFNEPALNTFDADLAKKRQVLPWKLTSEVSLPVRPLAYILENNLPAGQTIDFLTVDVEGRDLEVLTSNDWERFRPKMVLAETLALQNLDGLEKDPVIGFMKSREYEVSAKTFNTVLMIDRFTRL